MNEFEKLISILEAAKADFDKFYKKENCAAGTRIRKHMQDLRIQAKSIRDDVQSRKEKIK